MAVRQHQVHGGIFGTPPEPIFNTNTLHPELLDDWLCVLANENAINVDNAITHQGYFKNGDTAEFTFLLCEKMKLPPHCRYLALEIFDRFMINHIKDLRDHVMRTSSKKKSHDWSIILERVRNQIVLRIMSCCQLASKLTSHYKVVSSTRAQKVLKDCGHKYSMNSILQSELRILKTLHYKVMFNTPLLYIETLLELLGHNEACLEVKVYHGVSMRLLDLAYMQRKTLYLKLNQNTQGQCTPGDHSEKLSAVENDFMLLAVCVIAASSYILDQGNTDRVVESLAKITHSPTDDILDFTAVLIQLVIERNES